MKSTVHGLVSIDTAVPIVNEITLVGSRCGRMEAAIPLLKLRKVRVDGMISDRYALDRAPEAFAAAATKGVMKVLLTAS
jgi:alcohol dehydrogenase